MRIRSIRPEFWSSEDVAALPWDARLVFIGLWSYVDDNGVGRDVEQLIVAALFPLDEDLSEASVRTHGALKLLQDGGQITRYVVDGKPYLHVTAFDTHQKVNRPSTSRYPLPTSEDAEAHDTLSEPSVSPQRTPPTGEGEKGRRGEGEKKTTPSSTRGSRVPDPFPVDDELRTGARRLGFTDQQIDSVTAEFVDYWRGVPGAKGTKLDWPATWRNWLREEARRRRIQPPGGNRGGSGDRPSWEL